MGVVDDELRLFVELLLLSTEVCSTTASKAEEVAVGGTRKDFNVCEDEEEEKEKEKRRRSKK